MDAMSKIGFWMSQANRERVVVVDGNMYAGDGQYRLHLWINVRLPTGIYTPIEHRLIDGNDVSAAALRNSWAVVIPDVGLCGPKFYRDKWDFTETRDPSLLSFCGAYYYRKHIRDLFRFDETIGFFMTSNDTLIAFINSEGIGRMAYIKPVRQ